MELVTKDPDAIEAFRVPWATRLGSATISTSSFVVPAGITLDSDSNDSDSATAVLSGGTLGQRYDVVNRITTSDAQTLDYSFVVLIEQH